MTIIEKPKTKAPNLILFILIIPIIIILDQISKFYILHELRLNDIGHIEISRIFDLSMVWNRGVSFGVLSASGDFGRWALVALAGIISIVFFFWLLREERILSRFALSLVIGGAIGNLIDRVRWGAVADFLDFSGLGFPWVFNIADCAVVTGAGLLMLDMFLTPDKDKEKDPEKEPEQSQ